MSFWETLGTAVGTAVKAVEEQKKKEEQRKGREEKGAEPQQRQPKGGRKGRQKGQAPVTSSDVGGASFGNQQGARKKDKFSPPVQEGSGADARLGCSTNKQKIKRDKKQRDETTDQPLPAQTQTRRGKHKETHQEEREPQSPQHHSQKHKQKPKPTKGSNPWQAKKVPPGIDNRLDMLSEFGGATQNWTPVEFLFEEISGKKTRQKQSAKGSRRGGGGIQATFD